MEPEELEGKTIIVTCSKKIFKCVVAGADRDVGLTIVIDEEGSEWAPKGHPVFCMQPRTDAYPKIFDAVVAELQTGTLNLDKRDSKINDQDEMDSLCPFNQ